MTEINATPATLPEWCAVARNVWADLGAPIVSEDDPRYAELRDAVPFPLTAHSPEELGELYFEKFANLPECPLPAPVWAVSGRVTVNFWPSFNVEFSGPDHKDGDESAQVDQVGELFADAHTDPTGEQHLPGDLLMSAPGIYVPEHRDNLTAEGAEALARVLTLAAADLRRA